MVFRKNYYELVFMGARGSQAVLLVVLVGLVGNFISQLAKTRQAAPGELIGTLVVAVSCSLWTLLSFPAYEDTYIPHLATVAVDTVILVPLVVTASLLYGPLAQTSCEELPAESTTVLMPLATGTSITYITFVGAGRTTCYELLVVWDLLIGLCVLFTTSIVTSGFLWLGKRRTLGRPTVESQVELAPVPSSRSASVVSSNDKNPEGPSSHQPVGITFHHPVAVTQLYPSENQMRPPPIRE